MPWPQILHDGYPGLGGIDGAAVERATKREAMTTLNMIASLNIFNFQGLKSE